MAVERVAIVGAGAAGLAAASSYREHGGDGQVTLIGHEPLAPYRRPPLTKEFLRGELDRSELALQPAEWFEANRVCLRRGQRATAVDATGGTVLLAGGERLRADAIVLATGAQPVRPPLPGFDDPAVMTMRTLGDSVALAERARQGGPMLVIGTGFIGCEIAASLAMRGDDVTLIGEEALPQARRLGDDAASRIAGWLRDLGVELVCGTGVRGIEDARTVELLDGSRLHGAAIVLGMGARPAGELARAAGLAMTDGAVVVDEAMRTHSARSVLAVGDVARAFNVSAGRHLRVEHWGDALAHGALAGRTLAGADARWDDVPGFWSTIGTHRIKYAAWGDGHDSARLIDHGDGAFTVWYERDRAVVGVLTHERDEDYEHGRELVRTRQPPP